MLLLYFLILQPQLQDNHEPVPKGTSSRAEFAQAEFLSLIPLSTFAVVNFCCFFLKDMMFCIVYCNNAAKKAQGSTHFTLEKL